MGSPLVLASTSSYRQALLRRLAVPFAAVAPDYEEENDLAVPVPELVAYLARRKAESLRARFPGAIIIGSDQAAELEGALLGKPGTPEKAAAQLARLAGRTHRLLTAVCVLGPDGRREEWVDEQRLTMRSLTPEMIRRYVQADNPVDCAGAYKIESLGVALFQSVAGEDPTAIEGLPLMRLSAVLAEWGIEPLLAAGA